jgi:hypothetical protein
MTDYFLSYARADQATALRLADDLKAAGIGVWVDQYDIAPSAHWDREVHAALLRARGLLVVLSPRSADSPNVADEISVAINTGKHVIPILIEPCTVPLRLTRVQYIDAVGDYDDALARAVRAIRARAEGEAPRGDPAPQAPQAPFVPPPELLEAVERRLAAFVGPIAKVLVQTAQATARTLPDLYAEVARSIGDPSDRAAFLEQVGQAGAPDSPPGPAPAAVLPVETVEAIGKALIAYLGPIAGLLARREAAKAADLTELCERLADQIPSEADRVRFLTLVAKSGWA